MKQHTQNRIFQLVLAPLVLWIGWEALRALAASATVILLTPPSDRAFLTTVFVLAWGGIPGVAAAACATLAGALALRYPDRAAARSLALFCVSVAVLFIVVLFPTLFSELEKYGVPLLPRLPLGGLHDAIEVLSAVLAPASFFWFTASFPDSPRTEPTSRSLKTLEVIQRWAFRTPLVLVIGGLPLLLVPSSDSFLEVVLWMGLIYALAYVNIWVTHRTVLEPSLDRSLVVALSLAAPLLLLLFTPLAELLPTHSPWFIFDLQVLALGVGLALMVLGLIYAVFVQGAVGPALVIRKSVLYSVGGALGLFFFAGMENLLSDYVMEALGLPTRFSTFLVAGGMAVGFTWIRNRFGRGKGSEANS